MHDINLTDELLRDAGRAAWLVDSGPAPASHLHRLVGTVLHRLVGTV